ncbi:uncharacterized protein LOC104877518 [Vitis vinifera]|uniref:uncharacterized protein LOC104877518 n=1 Tax=Vitis vinifera TaxID=29760 RepID=UPI002883265A|nr:uncharacterized protein LOC104877518 [Vitis vinifera]
MEDSKALSDDTGKVQLVPGLSEDVISVGKKTRDSRTLCRNLKKNKPCPIKYCQRCLLNRYGEKAEEVAQLEDWKCPKCRGICNCSFCRKKIGCAPTGILVHKAKATGFSSVSEMLQVMDPDNSVKNVKEMVAYPKKACYPEQGVCGCFPSNLKGPCITNELSNNEAKPEQEDGDIIQEKSSGTGSSQKVSSDSIEIGENGEGDSTICQNMGGLDNAGAKRYKVVKSHTVKNPLKFQDRAFDVDVQFPQDTWLTTVTGIELPPEDVGDALQFLEFCAAFGKDLITYQTRHGLHP